MSKPRYFRTPFVRVDGVVAQEPLICLFAERKDEKAKLLQWYHTNHAGRLCRFKKTEDAEKLKKGQAYERYGTHVWFQEAPKEPYRGFFCAEIGFRRDMLDPEKDLIELKPTRDGKDLYFDVPEIAVGFRSFAGADITSMKGLPQEFTKDALKRQDGITREAYERYKALLRKVFKELLIDRRLKETGRADEQTESFAGSLNIVDQAPIDSLGGGLKGFRWTLDDAYFRVGDSDLQESIQGAGDRPQQDLGSRQQLWALRPALKPMPDLGYDAKEHPDIVESLKARIYDMVHRIADREKVTTTAGRQAVLARLLGQDPKERSYEHYFLDPKLSTGEKDKVSDKMGPVLQGLWLGLSEKNLSCAVADALAQASKRYSVRVVSSDEDKMVQLAVDKAQKTQVVESLIAAHAFTFATSHDRFNFHVIDVAKRVEAWWKTVPGSARKRLRRGFVRVDAYASKTGDKDFNDRLSKQRLANVVQALGSCIAADVGGDVPIEQKPWGEEFPEDQAPDPACFQSLEVYDDEGAYEKKIKEAEDNPWRHRVVTVRLYERVPVQRTKKGQIDLQYVRSKVLTQSSMLIKKASLVASVKRGNVHYALVFLTPGDPEAGIPV